MVPFDAVVVEVVPEIARHDKKFSRHMVEYEDGERKLTDLRDFSFRILKVGAPAATDPEPEAVNGDRRSSRPRQARADRYTPESSPLQPEQLSAAGDDEQPPSPTQRSSNGKRLRGAEHPELRQRRAGGAGRAGHGPTSEPQRRREAFRTLEEQFLSQHVMVHTAAGKGLGREPGTVRAVFGPRDGNHG
jgi:hypothetical protein